MNKNTQQPRGGDDRPGRILGSAHLKIQTRQAQRLVYGRRKSGEKNQIIGMLQFGFFVQKIWSGAAVDDPYADWFLLRIHDALERGREEIAEIRKGIEEQLKALVSIKIEIAHSVEPILIPIQFPNPYGYMGAYLIADFDDLCIALLTARHFGLSDRTTVEKQLARAASVVRRTFMSSAGWKSVGIARADFVLPTADSKARIEKAIELMGQCPPKILEGSLRSSMAPQIHRSSVDHAKRKGEHSDEVKVDLLIPPKQKTKVVTKKAKNLTVVPSEQRLVDEKAVAS
ncbi:MAG: TIGR03761 family integrating conjugative element protein [Gammaproteobacteria bacterium]|nr:TIGR03761 family integrating conjugative element protein [Gammaproteobacteria bacterium]